MRSRLEPMAKRKGTTVIELVQQLLKKDIERLERLG
jgi:hypothetical protein